jgi:DNA replication protein DnaC
MTVHDGRSFPPPSDAEVDFRRQQALIKAEPDLRAIPPRYAAAAADHPEVAAWVTRLIEIASDTADPWLEPSITRGPSLLLVGATGTGKTHLAYGAVRALLTSGVNCRAIVTTAADLYARLRPRHGVDPEAEFERVARARVLVVDDLGAAKGSEWTEEINYRLVNHRYEHETPTLFTSNVPPKNLAVALGERVSSRLIEMTTTVVLKGADRRLGGRP